MLGFVVKNFSSLEKWLFHNLGPIIWRGFPIEVPSCQLIWSTVPLSEFENELRPDRFWMRQGILERQFK